MDIETFNHLQPLINHLKLTILQHGYLKTGSSWQFTKLHASYNRLYFVIDGSGSLENDHFHLTLKKGKAYLIPGPNVLNLHCDHYLEKFYIHFKAEILPGQDLFQNSALPYYELDYDAINFSYLISRLRHNSLTQTFHLHAVLLDCISSCVDETYLKKQLTLLSQYEELFDYIRHHCFASLRVKEIAAQYNLSTNYLSQKFKQDTGMTLKKYIDAQLLGKAQEKLIFSTQSIKNISQEMRFTDEFHFSNFFKKHIGISPKEYRLQNTLYTKKE